MARLLLASAGLIPAAQAWYLPGVAPHDFTRGERVELKVNKLTSTRTQVNPPGETDNGRIKAWTPPIARSAVLLLKPTLWILGASATYLRLASPYLAEGPSK